MKYLTNIAAPMQKQSKETLRDQMISDFESTIIGKNAKMAIN